MSLLSELAVTEYSLKIVEEPLQNGPGLVILRYNFSSEYHFLTLSFTVSNIIIL